LLFVGYNNKEKQRVYRQSFPTSHEIDHADKQVLQTPLHIFSSNCNSNSVLEKLDSIYNTLSRVLATKFYLIYVTSKANKAIEDPTEPNKARQMR
jgi:hypothetical protein